MDARNEMKLKQLYKYNGIFFGKKIFRYISFLKNLIYSIAKFHCQKFLNFIYFCFKKLILLQESFI